jgi:ABC-type transport system involved in cytochrome bd biosynthesis fused ATPase/permease subunit
VADSPDAKPLVTHGAKVEFSHVEFNYETKRQILFDVDFSIPAGTTTAVVGHSGSGKSTLSRLLFRFYDVQQGGDQHRRPGHPQRHPGLAAPRDRHRAAGYGAVQRHHRIQHRLRPPGASREDIVAAARAASIHDFIESLPDGYATMVGERGLKLSGGEKQRVAIARTLAEESGDPDLRRSDVGAGLARGAGDPGAAEGNREAAAPRW